MSMLRRARGSESVQYLWKSPRAATGFSTAVSLHSHTLHSKESLDFIPRALGKVAPARAILHAFEDWHRRSYGRAIPFDRLFWRPPLHPRAAYELEARQNRETLGLDPLVSLTDHDNLDACVELRALNIPVPFSHEWTVPYENTVFHIGVHNLAADDAFPLFEEMESVTRQRTPEKLGPVLAALHSRPGVLVVLNHPLNNELKTGFREHARLLRRFLAEHAAHLHALELNGLQPAGHNRRVAQIAAALNLPVISGGDRHCTEPNANVNLTNAASFAEFVEEIRRERLSRVLFLPQYRESIPCRYLEFISQALAIYPEFAGRERWLDRIFKQTDEGELPVSSFCPRRAHWPLGAFVSAIGFIASPRIRATLRFALRTQPEAGA